MPQEFIEIIDYKENYKIKIWQDEPFESPRGWDNIGTMICWHRRYNLGDKHSFKDSDDFNESICNPEKYAEIDTRYDELYEETYNMQSSIEADKERKRLRKAFQEEVGNEIYTNNVILPVFLYDHSGISIRTEPFSCPWDSGQVGWIYCSNEKALEEFSDTSIIDKDENLKQARERAKEYMEGEVKTYNQYLNNEIYGYDAVWVNEDESEEEITSCGGFYGDQWDKEGGGWEHMISDAKECCDHDEKVRFPLLKPIIEEEKQNG